MWSQGTANISVGVRLMRPSSTVFSLASTLPSSAKSSVSVKPGSIAVAASGNAGSSVVMAQRLFPVGMNPKAPASGMSIPAAPIRTLLLAFN